MRMNEIDFDAQPPIDGYGPGGFRVAGEWYDGALIITADGPATFSGAWDHPSITALIDGADSLDLVLFGMGDEIAALPRTLRETFEQAGMGVEVMSTSSACRTYNVLLTEDRRVAAVLLPV